MEPSKADDLPSMPKWQQMQYKSFRAWCNYNLKDTDDIEFLSIAFHNGLLLAKLLEHLSGSKIKGIKTDPKIRIHNITNLHSCFAFIRAVPIQLHNMQAEDIADGNIKLILGLLWMLILHYQISHGKLQNVDDKNSEVSSQLKTEIVETVNSTPTDPRTLLLARVNYLLASAHFVHQVTNFTSDWQDGLSFLAMIVCKDPSLLNFETQSQSPPLDNLKLAFDLLQDEWGVPKLLEPEDLIGTKPDEKSVMTYVSIVLDRFDEGLRTPRPTPAPPSLPVESESESSSSSSSSDSEPEEEPAKPLELHIRVASARQLAAADLGGKSDPYCKVKIQGRDTKSKYKTQVVKKTLNPEWNAEFDLENEDVKEDEIIRFKVMDWDAANKDDPLGYVDLPVSKILSTPVLDEWLPLTDPKKDQQGEGELHLIIAHGPGSRLPPVEGEPLTVRVCAARNLEASDSNGLSDPYCKIQVQDRKDKPFKTNVEKGTLHPVWNKKFTYHRGYLKRDDTLTFTVFDWDRVGDDDLLGTLVLPVSQFESEPEFDQWIPFSKGQGEIHLQAAYGDHANLPHKPKGKPLYLRVARGKNLKAADNDGFSDPYCIVKVVNRKLDKKYKTEVVKGTLNPVWNNEFLFEGSQVGTSDVLRFDVYDWDRLSKKDPLGHAELPLSSLSQNPVIDTWLPLYEDSGAGQGEIHVVLAYGDDVQLPPIPEGKPLALRVAEAKDLLAADRGGTSDPYCVVEVVGAKSSNKMKTPVIKKTLNPVWNHNFNFPAGEIDADADVLRFNLFDHDVGSKDDPLGSVELPLNSLQDSPVLDLWLPVTLPSSQGKGKGKGDETQGQLRIQLALGADVSLPPPAETSSPRGAPVKIRIVAARGLKAADSTGTSDPYCVIEIEGKKTKNRIATKTIKKTLAPVWNEEFDLLNENIDPQKDVISFSVLDWDRVGKNDPLGKVQLAVTEIVNADVFDEWVPLGDYDHPGQKGQGEIRIVAVYDKDLPSPEGDFIPLKIRIAAARDLMAADSNGFSDPYVSVELPREHGQKQIKTNVIKKTLNPVWNEEFDLGAEGVQESDLIRFNVFDWDRVGKNDPLGHIEIPVEKLISQPVTDEWIPLLHPDDEGKQGQGELYLQAAYGDAKLPGAYEPPKTSILKIRVAAGKSLLAADKGGTSDPYCIVKIEGKKLGRELKTKTIKGTLNPEWNDEFTLSENDKFDPATDTLHFALFDWDRVGKNDPLGAVWLDGQVLLENPEFDAWLPVKNHKKKDKDGEGELRIQLAYGPNPSLPSIAAKDNDDSSSDSSSSDDDNEKQPEKAEENGNGDGDGDGDDEDGPSWTMLKTFWNYNKARNFQGIVTRIADKDDALQFKLNVTNESNVGCFRISGQLAIMTEGKKKPTKSFKEAHIDKKNAPGHQAKFNTNFTIPLPKDLPELKDKQSFHVFFSFHFKGIHTQQPLDCAPFPIPFK